MITGFTSLVVGLAVFLQVVQSGLADRDMFGSLLGFGKQRLERFNGVRDLQIATSCENVSQHWFAEAVIDNFAPVEQQQRWFNQGQRYWLNRQFWGGNNYPIIVFIGGEGEESCGRLTNRMYAFELAREHRALMVNVEHRFYGKSIPTPDTSTKSLQFLSSEQALADLARIIGFIKKDLRTEQSRVITVGGSYPGNMAAWFRLKYPSVTHGSIASSAPLVAQTNFPEYMDVVGQALIHFSGQKCFDAMENAAEIVNNLMLQGLNSTGMAKLEKDFEACSHVELELDASVFLMSLMDSIQGTVQYNNERKVMNVTDICKVMTQSDDNYANFVELQRLYRIENSQKCTDASWKDTVKALHETSASRSWTYQTCNEFGYFQTTDSKHQPLHSWKLINLDFYRAICAAAFDGWKADPQVDWMNQVYGALQIDATNIVFPQGTIDPWHALGVTNVTAPLPNPSEKVVYIEGTAHCHDLYAPASSDPPSLVFAREVIADTVRKWLA